MKINSTAHKIRKIYSQLFPRQLIVDDRCNLHSCLTFDDGPHPKNTKKIIEILEDHNVKCTFFLSGNAVEENPHLVKLIHENGHQLANHGYYHSKISDVGVQKYIQGVEKVQYLLCEITGEKIEKVFRPPYGEIKPYVFYNLISKGYQFALWSYDSCDSYMESSSDVFNYIKNNALRESEIILAHEDYQQTVDVLPKILKLLKDNNHKLVTINQLLFKK